LLNTELPQFSTYKSVDMNALFSDNESTFYSTDGIHPDATGYNAMGDAWSSSVLNSAAVQVAPEPSTFAMILAGLAMLCKRPAECLLTDGRMVQVVH
jgi:hypothetical protein